jgi:hypothetical protein
MNRIEQYESTASVELLPSLLLCAEDLNSIKAVLKNVRTVTVELFLELLGQRLMLAAMKTEEVSRNNALGSLLASSAVLSQLLVLLR